MIETAGHLVVVVHDDDTNPEQSVRKMVQAVRDVVAEYGRCVVLHDARRMTHVTEAYARAFASGFLALKQMSGVEMVACIPRAVPRLFAKVATRLAGVPMAVLPTSIRVREHFAQRDPETLQLLQQVGLCRENPQ